MKLSKVNSVAMLTVCRLWASIQCPCPPEAVALALLLEVEWPQIRSQSRGDEESCWAESHENAEGTIYVKPANRERSVHLKYLFSCYAMPTSALDLTTTKKRYKAGCTGGRTEDIRHWWRAKFPGCCLLPHWTLMTCQSPQLLPPPNLKNVPWASQSSRSCKSKLCLLLPSLKTRCLSTYMWIPQPPFL